MKVSDLTGSELDAWVALAEGLTVNEDGTCSRADSRLPTFRFSPSTNWADCGPLVEKHNIAVFPVVEGWGAVVQEHRWVADTEGWQDGATPQEAICRAVVARVFGEEV